jgi:hypothetical protein
LPSKFLCGKREIRERKYAEIVSIFGCATFCASIQDWQSAKMQRLKIPFVFILQGFDAWGESANFRMKEPRNFT